MDARQLARLGTLLLAALAGGGFAERAAASPPPAAVAASVPVFGKYEATLRVPTRAADRFWPYDANPPRGIPAGTGVSVDALLTDPAGRERVAPCFWYGSLSDPAFDGWRLRFAPDQEGTWRFRLRVRDREGERMLPGQASFVAAASDHPGFVRVSPADPRYFEHSRAGRTFLPAPAVHADTPQEIAALAGKFGLARTWAQASNNVAISSMTGQGGNVWVGGGVTATAPPGQLRAWAVGVNAQVELRHGGPSVKNQRYRLEILTRTSDTLRPDISPVNITNRSAMTARASEWAGWEYRNIEFTATNTTAFDNWVYPRNDLPGVSAPAVLARASARALDGQGQTFGPELLKVANPSLLQFYGQRDAARIDAVLDAATSAGVYLKIVVFEKVDHIGGSFAADGSFVSPDSTHFYGHGGVANREAIRWLQAAYARYFAARWGYSPHVHSAEYLNEGDPNNGLHFAGAAAFSRALKAACARPILATTSCWHSQTPQWEHHAADLDYVDVHEYLGTGGGRQPRVLGFRAPQMLVAEPGNPANGVLRVVNSDGANRGDRVPSFDPVPLIPGERFTVRGRFRVLDLGPMAAANPREDTASFTVFVGNAPNLPEQALFQGAGHKRLGPKAQGDTGWVQLGGQTLTAPASKGKWLTVTPCIYSRTGTYLFDDIRVDFPDRPGAPTYRIPGGDAEPSHFLHDDLGLTLEWAWRTFTGGGGPSSLPRPLAKPWVWGELGVWTEKGEDPRLRKDGRGRWVHDLAWGCINPGAVYPMWWTASLRDRATDRSGLVAYRTFMAVYLEGEGRLSNGRWRDAVVSTSPGLVAYGQSDPKARLGHLWVRNASAAWGRVMTGKPAARVSGSVTLALPDGVYRVTAWDTRSGKETGDPTVLAEATGGRLRLLIDGIAEDVAYRITSAAERPRSPSRKEKKAGGDGKGGPPNRIRRAASGSGNTFS